MLDHKIFKWVVLIIALIVLLFAFYWHQTRVSQIKKTCNQQALTVLEESNFYDTTKYENMYTACLRNNGLAKE